jgi:hypothetical protein
MHFVWHGKKSEANLRKHKVTFEEAVSVFHDPLSATFRDPDAGGEQRFITIGHSSRQRLLVVVHTEEDERIRIISARPATVHERKQHEN